jgi:DNA repair exonuclease SbcCD nuclease subunit
VYGLAYDRAEEPDPLATYERSDAPGFHVVLLHGSAHFSPHWGLGRNALQLPLEALRGLDCDYIALGDYHRFRAPLQFSEDGEIPACYPGSFAALNLREEGPKGYVVVELEAGKAPVISHGCSSVAPLQRVGEIDVSGAADHNGVVQRAAAKVNEGALPIVRLTGVADFPLDVELIRLQLQERFGFAQVEDASTFYSSHRLDELAAEDTVRGYVVRLARKRIGSVADDEKGPISEEALRLALMALGVT